MRELAEEEDDGERPVSRNGSAPAAMTQTEVNGVMAAVPASQPVSPFYAFTFRNYRLFFYGQLISVCGTWMQSVAQQWLVWELTHKAYWLGIVAGASAIPTVLFSLWGGTIADRFPRRATLVWTQTAMMVLAFILAALAYDRGILRPWHIALLSGLLGTVNALNMPAQQAFVTDMVDDRKALGNAIALNSLRFNVARFIGPILAGMVLVRAGVAMCFFLNGLSFIAVIVSLLMMRLPPHKRSTNRVSMAEGFRYIRGHLPILRTVLMIGIGGMAIWSVSTLFPVFASGFHTGARGFSGMMAANGVGAASGGMFLTLWGERIPRRNLIYGGALFSCLSVSLFALAPSYWIALPLLVLSGFAMIIFAISCNTKVQSEAPDAMRGRIMAVYSLVSGSMMQAGGPEIGFLAGYLHSAQMAIELNAAVCVIATSILLGWSQLGRRRAARSAGIAPV